MAVSEKTRHGFKETSYGPVKYTQLAQVIAEDGLWHLAYITGLRTLCMQEVTVGSDERDRDMPLDCEDCRRISERLPVMMQQFMKKIGRYRGPS
jgi:hypothetical protein